jgi:UDP-glucose 4-epimerase
MRVFLTGGSGFIGVGLINILKEKNIDFITLERSEWDGSDGYNKLLSYLNIDEDNRFIHLAGVANLSICESDVDNCNYVNVTLLDRLLDFLKDKNIKQFIFSSSMAVYGDTAEKIYNEDDIAEPINAYGFSKLNAEKVIERYSIANSCKYLILRMGNCYGSVTEKYLYSRGVLSYLVEHIIDKKDISLDINKNSYKSAKRSFLNIDDLYSFIIKVLYDEKLADKNNFEVFNLVGDDSLYIYDIYYFLAKVFNYKGNLLIKFSDNVYNGQGDNHKAKSLYNWYPNHKVLDDLLFYQIEKKGGEFY